MCLRSKMLKPTAQPQAADSKGTQNMVFLTTALSSHIQFFVKFLLTR